MSTMTTPHGATLAAPAPTDDRAAHPTNAPIAPPTPFTPSAIALTPEGRASLEQELRHLRGEALPGLTAQLAESRAETAARHENAELVTLQLERQRLDRRAADLEWLLSVAHDVAPPADGVIALGSRVEVEDEGERDVFRVVDPREANVAAGRLSLAAPLGQALLGHRAGDEIVVAAPTGERPVRVIAVS